MAFFDVEIFVLGFDFYLNASDHTVRGAPRCGGNSLMIPASLSTARHIFPLHARGRRGPSVELPNSGHQRSVNPRMKFSCQISKKDS